MEPMFLGLRSKVRFRVIFLVGLSLKPMVAQGPAGPSEKELIPVSVHPDTLHAEFRKDLILVPCEINGVTGLRCLLDTGSSMSGLSPALAKRLHLKVSNETGAPASSPLAYSLPPFSVRLGTNQYMAERAGVAPLQQVTDALGEQIDALLGTSLFEHFQVTVDPSTSEVQITVPGTPVPPTAQPQQIILPLHVPVTFLKLLSTDHRGIIAPFMVDTGSMLAILLSPPFWSEHPGLATQHPGTGNGEKTMTIDALRLFGIELRNVPASEPLEPSGVLNSRLTGGILGAPILNNRFIVTYDFGKGTMYTRPLPDAMHSSGTALRSK
jgi:hypothetical protein